MKEKTLTQELAEESIVLIKNECGVLPLKKGEKLAVFGRAQIKTVFSGNGSGASRNQGTEILNALEAAGFETLEKLSEYYREKAKTDVEKTIDWELLEKTGNSGLAYEMFGQYRAPVQEYEVSEELLKEAAEFTEYALLVLGRNSGGEECDRRLADDYLLTESEMALLRGVCAAFEKVILVLNVNGQTDIGWLDEFPQIKSMLFIGIPGEDGASALAGILMGRVNPSGRLSFSMFRRYEDFPAAEDFSFDKDAPLCYQDYGLCAEENGSKGFARSPVTVYREGSFFGYRTLGAPPVYPFGHGLSYTEFEISPVSFEKENGFFLAAFEVKNTGTVPGREALLVYWEREAKKLWGFEKTPLLQPGESARTVVLLSCRELAEYDESLAAWVISKGMILVTVSGSGRKNREVETISVAEDIVVERVKNRLSLRSCNQGKLHFAKAFMKKGETVCPDRAQQKMPETAVKLALSDLVTLPQRDTAVPKLPQLSEKELAALCVGYGPGVPFAALSRVLLPNTIEGLTVNDHPTGALGYVSPAIPQKGIHSVYYKDGPAGIGNVAWPTEMLLGCSFDQELLYRFGNAVGAECEAAGVDVWLAPAVNLHRNPLGGRCFEYFSEDPLLTGKLAAAVARGVQENHPVLVCPKHFACNEQETCRRGSEKKNYDAADSIIEEKTLREVYLKPFEILVREADIACIMTSFNKINGTFSAGSHELCTDILRDEWGFCGCVVTDWGDMDTVADGADAVAAGNDVVMPGGPGVIEQILNGMEDGRVAKEQLEAAVRHLLQMTGKTKRASCGIDTPAAP